MNRTKPRMANPGPALLLGVAGFLAFACVTGGQEPPHLSITVPGGIPGQPILTGIESTPTNVIVTWDGPAGYYQLYSRPSLKDQWRPVGGLNANRIAILPASNSNSFFRISTFVADFAGSQACAECHFGVHQTVLLTPHTEAFDTLKRVGQDRNASCLPCHTVGAGLPTGFVSETTTRHLRGVQCENCHGPAAAHAANPEDPVMKPRVELASTMCGGCHNSAYVPPEAAAWHPPYYEDWNRSGHRAVLPELQADFTDARGPTVYIPNCGGCHSGTVREALLENDPLPSGHEAGAVGIACATCHETHRVRVFTNVITGTVHTNLLRYPLTSLQDHHTTGSFATNHNPAISICAQCHNDRGAAWTSSSRPPHHSPQYNFLLGTVGELASGVRPNQPAAHAVLEKQCITCHMQTTGPTNTPPAVHSGHSFKVETYESCQNCHPLPELLVEFTAIAISNQVQQTKFLLDLWATTKAPTALRGYGTLAWEYTSPGDLSPGGTGPTSTEQALIPVNIRKARFNLYVVLNDGSSGTHNGPFAITLLETARAWIEEELRK